MSASSKAPDSLSDEALMSRYLAGESWAFEQLYARHSARVYSFIRKRIQAPEEADELFQRVFAKFHASRHRYDKAYPVLQWLYVMTKSALVDYWRLQNREVPLENPDLLSQSPPSASLTSQEGLLLALEGLPLEQQQAIQWRVVDEATYEQIARRLGRTETGVRQLVSRGLRKLKALAKESR